MRQARTWSEDKTGTRVTQTIELDDAQAIQMVQTAINAAAREGNTVIVGRGGQVLLQGRPDALHVRIEAPFESRARRVQVQAHMSLDAARELVTRRDKASNDYLERFYETNGANTALYHLAINTDKGKPSPPRA